MKDYELLEGAAKAAGLILLQVPNQAQTDADWWAYAKGSKPNTAKPWNPLIDDGDAFRLLADMQMDIFFGVKYIIVDGAQVPTANNANDAAWLCGELSSV